jgi:hypothetical protein
MELIRVELGGGVGQAPVVGPTVQERITHLKPTSVGFPHPHLACLI